MAVDGHGEAGALATVCEAHGVTLCYLFGSQSENAWRILLGEEVAIDDPLTDIDVGVVLAEFESHREANVLHRIYARLLSPLQDLFSPYTVDLVFLQEHHSVFQMEAIKGRCAYSIGDEYRFDYEEAIARRAADFRPVLDAYLEDVAQGFREHYGLKVGWCEMLSRNRIMERLDLINSSVARMQRFAGMPYDDFIADPDNAAIVESYLRRSLPMRPTD